MKRKHEQDPCFNEGLYDYVLLVIGGLEAVAEKEIRAKVRVVKLQAFPTRKELQEYQHLHPETKHLDYTRGAAGSGKLLLTTPDGPATVLKLNSIQCALALISTSSKEINTLEEFATDLAKDPKMPQALKLWTTYRELEHLPEALKFRASAIRDGTHAFNSQALAAQVGYAFGEKYPKWTVDLVQYDLQVVVVIHHNYSVTGIVLAPSGKMLFKSRLPPEERRALQCQDHVSTLRPSTTYMMLELAQLKPGDLVLDCMAGIGTIPIYATVHHPLVFSFAGDFVETLVSQAQANARNQRLSHVDVCQWDARFLPLRDNSMDAVIIDLPFGVRCNNFKQTAKMLPKILKQLERVLRPETGRSVLLTLTKKLIKGSIKSTRTLAIVEEYAVNIGGLGAAIFVLEKH